MKFRTKIVPGFVLANVILIVPVAAAEECGVLNPGVSENAAGLEETSAARRQSPAHG